MCARSWIRHGRGLSLTTRAGFDVCANACRGAQSQLSGYGANSDMVHKLVKNMGLKEPVNLSAWGEVRARTA